MRGSYSSSALDIAQVSRRAGFFCCSCQRQPVSTCSYRGLTSWCRPFSGCYFVSSSGRDGRAVRFPMANHHETVEHLWLCVPEKIMLFRLVMCLEHDTFQLRVHIRNSKMTCRTHIRISRINEAVGVPPLKVCAVGLGMFTASGHQSRCNKKSGNFCGMLSGWRGHRGRAPPVSSALRFFVRASYVLTVLRRYVTL